MTLRFIDTKVDPDLANASVFVSASIPDPNRWDGYADPLEITDAVVSLARVFLTAGMRVVTAAHPTIAPLLEYVAAELPPQHRERIVIYQSRLFEDVLPTATRRFEADGVARVVWTNPMDGDKPIPGEWDRSLNVMRRQMLSETEPSAAIFVGGMSGIPDEFALFKELRPGRPTYPIGFPGGEARTLARDSDSPLRAELVASSIYPALWRSVLTDLATH